MQNKEMLTLVIFSGDLDKLLAAFIIATGAAASGMQVNMFFTFWGLKLLQRADAGTKGLNWMQKLFSLFVKPGSERRPISKLNMFGMGAAMMKKIMKKSKMPTLGEMILTAKSLNVKLTACSTSMNILGISRESLIPEVEHVAGVASFLADSQQSHTTLFI
ncbi:DsrE/DsrF/DrsH-like family protein [candidate division KSB1 bacterium]|nr:DsrE/DsrF/DrsH-like family protein [candidate division KSB1 bacterium]